MNVKLKKISTNSNKLRTDTVYGYSYTLPSVGLSFRMYAEGIEPGTIRVVTTSLVEEITPGGFKTLNSEYEFEVLD